MKITFKYKRLIYIVENNISEHNKYRLLDILSAVALSFLLCMNQAYGANKACSILLIDDPVQTIDDVNMVGFVDILRYEFGDRQIFISTHEQSFEWFLRYRYSKAEKKVNVFNMKDIMLQEK